jgi:hypothetical protein
METFKRNFIKLQYSIKKSAACLCKTRYRKSFSLVWRTASNKNFVLGLDGGERNILFVFPKVLLFVIVSTTAATTKKEKYLNLQIK